MQADRLTNLKTTDSGEVRHRLTSDDGAAVEVMRKEVAPFKGAMTGPAARAPFDAVMEQTPDASDVVYEDGSVGGIGGLWCRPANARPEASVLYLHGGAYVLGSAHAFRHIAGQFAARANVRVFVADYRLAPEHAFPAAVEDAKSAYRGLVEQGAQAIVIVGDSAGGGLALALLAIASADARAGHGLAPSGALVMSPWTDLALTGDSLASRADDDPLLTKQMLSITAASYLDGHEGRDPMCSPLYGELAGLPPIQLHVGTNEVLLDDARRYTERARAADVEATVHIWEGMTHVFPASVGSLDAAEEALTIAGAFLDSRFAARADAALTFNENNIIEFRESGGRLKSFGDAPVLLLTTTGARSGRTRTSPMMYLADGNDADRVYVFASAAGADKSPSWFHNIVANPTALGVEIGSEHITANADILTNPRRADVYATQADCFPGFADYQAKTAREIPVVALNLQRK
jgi:deazaflavin-dependent oxidoreductase (nitroreductase family)